LYNFFADEMIGKFLYMGYSILICLRFSFVLSVLCLLWVFTCCIVCTRIIAAVVPDFITHQRSGVFISAAGYFQSICQMDTGCGYCVK